MSHQVATVPVQTTWGGVDQAVVDRFAGAVAELEGRFVDAHLGDEDVEAELHAWLDEPTPLPWVHPTGVTPDEWFFVSTLYGEMTMDGQRTHIRKYFPALFVTSADRDIRNFVPGMSEYQGLRSAWMSQRLAQMGEILRERGLTMSDYATRLRDIDAAATADNPMPALDTMIRDHRATGWKTLSVFVRDCVKGNAFPIDSRVAKELKRHVLPLDERLLVSVALAAGRDPRRVARMFFVAGGDRP